MEESFCIGTYGVRDGRVWLSSERGWCVEGQLRRRCATEGHEMPLRHPRSCAVPVLSR